MSYFNFPAKPREHTILELREFSRKLVRELGFMRPSLAESDLAPSAVHAIIEIGLVPGIQARNLAGVLRLDKSNTSRQVAKLEALGLIRRENADDDGRSFMLYLTNEGQKLRKKIDRFATDQVSGALRQLTRADQQALVRSLALYTDALTQNNAGKAPPPGASIDQQIVQGYQPGCIGDIASLHGRYYAQTSGFGVFFERRVATELAAFAQALPCNGKALWLYVENGKTLGSIAIDGDPGSGIAHLLWFIFDDALRGSGVGRRLLSLAMDFVDLGFEQTYLWTFKGLDTARHLYESSGFKLTDEAEGSQWGSVVVEQKFSRRSAKKRR
jgi:DNA-binding MarR family transcriptional regulator/GNAT superfamily N-acetyltransferase